MGIKGHMSIELADGKTGKVVERHEDDNLVTNGVKHYFKNMGMFNITPFQSAAGQIIYSHQNNLAIPLFGGLMLFDTAQTENAEHVFVSGGTKMTGNGINGYASNDSVTEFGSYNSEESGWQSDGSFKQVWDFTTSQANGTIACACLCPYNYAAYGEGNGTSKVIKTTSNGMSASSPSWWTYQGFPQAKRVIDSGASVFGTNFEAFPIKIDSENNYAIMLGWQSGIDKGLFKAVKVAFPWNKFDIRDGVQGSRLLSAVQDITLPSQITTLAHYWATRPQCFVGVDDDGALYYALNTASYNSNLFNSTNQLHIVKFVIGANDTVTCEYVTALTPSMIGETTGNWFYTAPHCLKIVNKNLFLATGTVANTLNREKWFKIGLGQNMTVERVTDNTASNFTAFSNPVDFIPIKDSNCLYAHGGTSNVVKVDLTAKEVLSLNGLDGAVQSGSVYGAVDNRMAMLMYSGNIASIPVTFSVNRWLRFLSTINNLENPVVKTADKTMKVTYVLRFDAE